MGKIKYFIIERATGKRADYSDQSDRSDPYSIRTVGPEAAANTLICLINQATFLLRRQIQKLEESFLREGGFTERMYRARRNRRTSQTGRTRPTRPTGRKDRE